jgi:hypothetical protein
VLDADPLEALAQHGDRDKQALLIEVLTTRHVAGSRDVPGARIDGLVLTAIAVAIARVDDHVGAVARVLGVGQ